MTRAGTRTVTRKGHSLLADAAVILGAFAVAGVVAGLLWPQLVAPVEVVRTEFGLSTAEVYLAQRFDNDGWFIALGAALGLILGVLLTAWRRTDEVRTLFLVVAGAAIASWLAGSVGRAAGPEDPSVALADAAVGTTAQAAVVVDAGGAWFAWPIAALLGTCLVLWGTRHRSGEAQSPSPPPSPSPE